jgi:hypothetical protein
MRFFKIVGGLVSFALAVLFCAPLAIVVWIMVFPVYQDGSRQTDLIIGSLSVGGHVFSGWQLWLVVITFALVGVAFALIGFYAFKSRKSAA